jgi:serine/threonine-protein kinase
MLLPEHRAPRGEATMRLERETRVAAAIVHPNVCSVTDAGHLEDGSPYLVMELLSGETLASRLVRGEQIPLIEALQIAGQLLNGVAAAHRLGIVHRDLKPANTFLVDLGPEGSLVKLLDFGAATMPGLAGIAGANADATLTRAGLVVGTIPYMAPEQIQGVREFDTRTDVYACGLIVYEMLTGRHPFAGLSAPQLAEAVAFRPVPSLAEVAPRVPEGVARAVDTALAPDRKQRHADAAAFLLALRGGGDAVSAKPELGDWELPTRQRLPPPRRG